MKKLPADLGLDQSIRPLLVDLARTSIMNGLLTGEQMAVRVHDWPRPAQENRAAFVTLKTHGRLRGCVGTLEATKPLVQTIARFAFSAAFQDPRFQPLQHEEMKALNLHISVLGPLESLAFSSESELASQLRAGVDGLLLIDGIRRGTLLPSAWGEVTESASFVSTVKKKAGMGWCEWPASIQAFRYQTFEFTSP